MDSIATLLLLIPAAPLASAVLIPILAPRLLRGVRPLPAVLAIAGIGVSLVCSLLLVREIAFHHAGLSPETPRFERVITLWTWADVREAYHQELAPPAEGDQAASVQGGPRDFSVDVTLRADALTAMMLAMVTFISTLVAVFSVGYMHGDRSYWRFFTYVSLFVFSMTMLVAASNFLLLFVFWEGVGVCSYLLIGFWYEQTAPPAAGKKAFLVNRVGDFGFALALMLIWITYGTLNYHTTAVRADAAGTRVALDSDTLLPDDTAVTVQGVLSREPNALATGPVSLAICLLLLLGACGKSAQFPLHVWLPDAMEGPTPVSALIHAATMVTAGVYMIARCTPLFTASPDAQLIVASVGAFTALLAALIALTQFDLKRVLAYSTISQLGYMFVGLGAGTFAGVTAGMFHLFTHAFFKALLFLGAGSVMHAMGHVIDMRRFGGLRRLLPATHWTFLIGCLALAGIFPLAGFWSKDAIMGAVHDRAHSLAAHEGAPHAATAHAPEPSPSEAPTEPWALVTPAGAARIYNSIYYVALLTAFLTSFYTFRAFFLTFYGETRTPPEAEGHIHEPPSMAGPLIVLAVCTCLVGIWLDHSYQSHPSFIEAGRITTGNRLADFLGFSPQLAYGRIVATRTGPQFHYGVAATSSLAALAGLLLAGYLYLESRREVNALLAFFRLDWYQRVLDADSVARMRHWKWVRDIDAVMQRLYLGWLARGLGRLGLLSLWIATAPLLLLHFASPYRLSQGKFFFDELYDWTIVRPLKLLARLCAALDRWLVDGAVNAVGRVPVALGNLMRSLQMGLVPFYALSMAFGVLVLILARVFWGS